MNSGAITAQPASEIEYSTVNSTAGSGNDSAGTTATFQLTMFETRVVPAIYMIICVVGLLGNGLVIGALTSLMKGSSSKSVNDILVINLAVADFIFVGCLPFWAIQEYLRKRWLFGIVGCKLLSFNTLLNLYASVFFVVAMGIDRFFAVVFATKSISHRTPRKATYACAVIWLSAVLVACQALVWRTTDAAGGLVQCVWDMSDEYIHAYYVIRVAVGFVVPFMFMVSCYVMIIMKLKRRMTVNLNRSRVTNQQKKITSAILAVMSLFVVCWLPNHIVTVISAITFNDIQLRRYFNVQTANLVSVCLAYANSALNPILYAFMKEEIRQEGKRMICGTLSFFRNRPITARRGFTRVRGSVSRMRGTRRSFWRSTAATAVTTVGSKRTQTVPKDGYPFPTENGLRRDSNPPSYNASTAGEDKKTESNERVKLMVQLENEESPL